MEIWNDICKTKVCFQLISTSSVEFLEIKSKNRCSTCYTKSLTCADRSSCSNLSGENEADLGGGLTGVSGSLTLRVGEEGLEQTDAAGDVGVRVILGANVLLFSLLVPVLEFWMPGNAPSVTHWSSSRPLWKLATSLNNCSGSSAAWNKPVQCKTLGLQWCFFYNEQVIHNKQTWLPVGLVFGFFGEEEVFLKGSNEHRWSSIRRWCEWCIREKSWSWSIQFWCRERKQCKCHLFLMFSSILPSQEHSLVTI